MSAEDGVRSRHVPIAPAHPPAPGSGTSRFPPVPMPYACSNCTKRKVKCDKSTPRCSSCRRSKLECGYQLPQRRALKRKPDSNLISKLMRYERILKEHGLLEVEDTPAGDEKQDDNHISLHWNEPAVSSNGRLLAGDGKSRYVHGNLWANFEDEDVQQVSDMEEEDAFTAEMEGAAAELTLDPLSGAFLGAQCNLLRQHPSYQEALKLWDIHVENVEPLCKVLHIPTTRKMVERVSINPEVASRSEECQLFAIYHFAVYSLTDEECSRVVGHARSDLLEKYNFATRQALVNASFLKTTELSVVQALILFLQSCRFYYDSQTYWVLSGVAVRIAQRLGLHRDGEDLGLPPFEVQMRRRVFYQLLPIEGVAAQMAGTGIAMTPDFWDTRAAANVNDDQIWPGMREMPQDSDAATDMIFCLARLCIGKHFAKSGRPNSKTGSQFRDYDEAERTVQEAEKEVEEKYIRYCDVVNPLHFLAMGLARAGIIAMRLRIRLTKVRNNTATDVEMKEIFSLAMRLMDTDAAIHSNDALAKYRWHARPLSLWGTWDSLIFILTSMLKRSNLLSDWEVGEAWDRIENIYTNHTEIMDSHRALYMAFGRLTLKAWDARPPITSSIDREFIAKLRAKRKAWLQKRNRRSKQSKPQMDSSSQSASTSNPTPPSDTDFSSNTMSDVWGLDFSDEFNLDASDWTFWNQLMQNNQA